MENNTAYDKITQIIIAELEKGSIPWQKPWATAGAPVNAKTGKEYRGINTLVLGLTAQTRGFKSNLWLTFNQAKDMGGYIKKGATGTPVVFWKLFTAEDKDTGEETTIPLLRHTTAFNLDQTEGVELPESRATTEHPEPLEPIVVAERVVDNMPNKPQMTVGGSRAFYKPSTDTVNMPERQSFKTSEGYYGTLFHELGHATGHASRLNRKGIASDRDFFGGQTYSKEELVAELTAAFVCGSIGIATTNEITNSVAYIQSWLKALKDDRKLLVHAAAAAQKAADYILGKVKPVDAETE